MSLPAPFGKYELIERIGSGGMADVFLARSFGVAGFEKHLVLKRIKAEHARDPRFVSLFIHEAKIGVHLNHPNIVSVYELGKVGESWYIAMEHLHGQDLNKVGRALRSAERRMPPLLAVRVVAEVLRGLSFAHGVSSEDDRMALVHRDVSPHNIFLTYAGEVKLVDFGIARLLDGDAPMQVGDQARPGGGKYAYMSPEQASGAVIDPRTDIYSAGVVLWELLVGAKLHQGADPADKLRRVREGVIPHPNDRGADVDDALWRVLQRALAREPNDRYAYAALFEEDLRAWAYARDPRPPGRRALAEMLGELFPEGARHNPAAPDIRRLADDLRELEGDGASGASASDVSESNTASRATPAPIEAASDERKRVAALVVDVDGFTDISLRAEPEALFKRHLQMLRWLREVVAEHGGTIQHVHDDQAYVLFGMAKTRTDDLARALACAAELHRRAPELHKRGVPLHLAIGAHVGDITVGHAGSRVRYMARGNTTRFARRLSEQADHGQILVSDAVMRAMGGRFSFSRGPWLLGRGGQPPEPSYLLTRARSDAVSTQAGPWLTRGRELQVMRKALKRMSDGKGAAVVVHAPDGFGKSRFLQEIANTARNRRIRVYRGTATPFAHPLAACRSIVLQVMGVPPDAEQAAVREAVPTLRRLDLSSGDLEAIEALLGLGSRTIDTAQMWHALRRAVSAVARHQPTVFILEDVHHLPKRDLEHLAHMLMRLEDTPGLCLLSFAGPIEGALAPITPVPLPPLSAENQERLLAHVLGCATIDDALLALVERTCEGNPLYVKEFTSYLRERALVRIDEGRARLTGEVEAAVPSTLVGVVGARIDALDPASKGALQIAAIIGPSFDASLLADAVGVDDALPIINDLAGHGVLKRAPARDRWQFTSEFVRQAALRGILGVQKRDYHRLVAAALERRIGSSDDAPTEQLARHCGLGGRHLDAARYAYDAGRRHERDQELDAAKRCYARGLDWVRDAETTSETFDARTQGEVMLEERLGEVLLMLGQTRAGLRALTSALDQASDHGLPWIEVRAQLALGRHHLGAGHLDRAAAHLGQAQMLARLEGDASLTTEIVESQAALAHASGDGDRAVALWEEALGQARAPRQKATCLLGLSTARLRLGAFEESQALLDEALALAQGEDDRILEGRILNNMGLLRMWKDEPEAAVTMFRRALQVREDVGYTQGVVVNHHNIGDVHFMRGDHTRAYVSFQRSRDLAEEMGWQRGIALNDVFLGYLDGERGEMGRGLARIDSAVQAAERLEDADVAATGAWLRGRLLQRQGDAEGARAALDAAEALAKEHRLDPLLRAIARTRDDGS